jgi:hypothetical protein
MIKISQIQHIETTLKRRCKDPACEVFKAEK